MAVRIKAVTAYRPRIVRGDTATEERFMELVTPRTSLSTSVVKNSTPRYYSASNNL